jgi:uncharacterized protein YceK
MASLAVIPILFSVLVASMLMSGCALVSSEDTADAEQTEEVVAAGDEAEGDKDAASALVGQKLSKEDIEAQVGTGERFEMSSAGCERGVYAGYFYYKNFSIYSVTYDKGGTFTVKSVS